MCLQVDFKIHLVRQQKAIQHFIEKINTIDGDI
jgi:hypothetical protein